MIRRRLEKFTDAGGTNAIVFTDLNEEWDTQQEVIAPRSQVVGASYAIDQLGRSTGIKAVGTEVARFEIVADSIADLNEEHDDIRARAFRNGRGKLWSISGEDDRRWCWARARSMPELRLGFLNITWMPVVLTFDRLSDWYAESVTIHEEEDIDASPHDFNVVNSGSATVRNAIIEFRSKGVNGFQALTLSSLSTGDEFSSTRAAQGSNSILRVDCGRRTVEYSNDGGATWTADYGNFSYGSKQVDIMRLEPGTNLLRYEQGTGTPNLDIVVSFYPAYD